MPKNKKVKKVKAWACINKETEEIWFVDLHRNVVIDWKNDHFAPRELQVVPVEIILK